LTPFLADRLYHEVNDVAEGDSVHLANWPSARPERRDEALEASMKVARRLTTLGRAARAEAGVKVRQPLSRALVFLPSGAARPPAGVVEEELNVDELDFGAELGEVLSFELVPNFRSVGPKLGEAVKELRPALAALDSLSAATALESGQSIEVTLSTGTFTLTSDDVELRVKSQGGFAVSRDSVEAIALDLTLDDDLRQRGLVRDVVRQVQDLRKNSGLDVADRIDVRFTGLDDLQSAFEEIATEVLARQVSLGAGTGEGTALELDDARVARVWIDKV
jgi:isoleucyl-tRNA synthetase